MLLQSNESPCAYRVPVPDKYRLARHARARRETYGRDDELRSICFKIFLLLETSYPTVAPETNHPGYENPRRTLAGFSVSDLRARFTDRCPSIHLAHDILRVNGKKQRNVRESVLHYIGTNISYGRTIAPETERSVCNFVASAPVSRDLPCYSLFYVVRRASPSSRERGGMKGGGRVRVKG